MGAILQFEGREKELFDGAAKTTNNRMELTAAIRSLSALKRPCVVALPTDSQYMRRGIMEWIEKWKQNGWRTSDRTPVKNVDLWQEIDALTEVQRIEEIDALTEVHRIEWHWVRGHAGHDLNERADALARKGMAPFLKRPSKRGTRER